MLVVGRPPVEVDVAVCVGTFGKVVVVQRPHDGQRQGKERERQEDYTRQRWRFAWSGERMGVGGVGAVSHRLALVGYFVDSG